MEYLLIDGYNVINCWKEFKGIREVNLEHARELLIAGVSEYAAFKGYRATIVFDALDVSGPGVVEKIHGIEVAFTDEEETADSWIERKAYELSRLKSNKVFVVTSDYAEQINILGAGGYRISAREFHEDYKKAKADISVKLRMPDKVINRNELGSRIQGHVLEHLEKLRRSKN